ncbi:glycosyltransferase family 2 protein [Limimaricola sp. AA108-03]|uniref:glycosyltransferase family 2 protein n=1 Tax=Limimaricola sp. AA108-03 TaxID=3425945 RepID=UPI003D778CE5
MEHDGIERFAAALRKARHGFSGPVALVLIEDGIEVESTLRHHLDLGFSQVVAIAPDDLPRPDLSDPRLAWVRGETRRDGACADLVNAVIAAAAPGQWLFYCYNAEYLFFPFSEHRGVANLCAFVAEERRDSVPCVTLDLFAADLEAHPTGVTCAAAHLDRIGYYARDRYDAQGRLMERQPEIHGGLRWRLEEHVPADRRQILRIALFRTAPGLRLGADHRFNQAEYNTLQCPWHRSPTAATASFRTAKALRRNPATREAINGFDWPGATPFAWRSQQLLDLGLIEPGQWF